MDAKQEWGGDGGRRKSRRRGFLLTDWYLFRYLFRTDPARAMYVWRDSELRRVRLVGK